MNGDIDITDSQRTERIKQVLLEEQTKNNTNYWWLSFANADLPQGHQFLGVCIVKAQGIASAMLIAHTLGINPGGEIGGYELHSTPELETKLAPYTNKLISKQDLLEAGLITAQ